VSSKILRFWLQNPGKKDPKYPEIHRKIAKCEKKSKFLQRHSLISTFLAPSQAKENSSIASNIASAEGASRKILRFRLQNPEKRPEIPQIYWKIARYARKPKFGKITRIQNAWFGARPLPEKIQLLRVPKAQAKKN